MRAGLARWGLTHQVFKSALAASLAYWLAYHFVDHQFPVFAPMAALLTIQVTVFTSYSRGVQRILAIIIGVGMALLAFRFTGANWWIIFLVTFVALAIGTRMGLGIAAINQVPMSALLILAAKAYVPTYALDRIVDTVLGTLVALAVNLFLWPPNSLPTAEAAVGKLRGQTAHLLRTAADAISGVDQSPTPLDLVREARTLDGLLAATIQDIDGAAQSMKMNPRARALGPAIDRCRRMTSLLERASIQARGVAKSVAELAQSERALPETSDLARLIRLAADTVDARTALRQGRGARMHEELGRFDHDYAEVASRALTAFQDHHDSNWARYGSILSDVRHLVHQVAEGPASASGTRVRTHLRDKVEPRVSGKCPLSNS